MPGEERRLAKNKRKATSSEIAFRFSMQAVLKRVREPPQTTSCRTVVQGTAFRGEWQLAEYPENKKDPESIGFRISWQRVKDSNPHIQSQSLLCYPYTNPLYLSATHLLTAANRYYYTEKRKIVNRFFEKSFCFFKLPENA